MKMVCRLQVHVLGPAQRLYGDATENYPFTTVSPTPPLSLRILTLTLYARQCFVTLFTLFGLLPLLSFALFALFVLLALSITCGLFIAFWSIVLIGGAGLFLLGALFLAAMGAVGGTVAVWAGVQAYHVYRGMRGSTVQVGGEKKHFNGHAAPTKTVS